MKFCLSSRQTSEYLKKANEIKVECKDIKQLYDLLDNYSDKIFILKVNLYDHIDSWEELSKINKIAKINNNIFILGLSKITDIVKANENGIKNYWQHPVYTFSEIEGILNIYGNKYKPEYFLLAPPLTHSLETVQKKIKGIPVRLVANLSFLDKLPRVNGVNGGWIRPEEVENYENYNVTVLEFWDCDLKKEQALYRIYAEDKQWPGDLGIIISDLNYLGNNRLIVPGAFIRKLNCGQVCASGYPCRRCYTILDFSCNELTK